MRAPYLAIGNPLFRHACKQRQSGQTGQMAPVCQARVERAPEVRQAGKLLTCSRQQSASRDHCYRQVCVQLTRLMASQSARGCAWDIILPPSRPERTGVCWRARSAWASVDLGATGWLGLRRLGRWRAANLRVLTSLDDSDLARMQPVRSRLMGHLRLAGQSSGRADVGQADRATNQHDCRRATTLTCGRMQKGTPRAHIAATFPSDRWTESKRGKRVLEFAGKLARSSGWPLPSSLILGASGPRLFPAS